MRLYDCDHATPADEGVGFPYLAIPNLKNGRLDLNGVRRIGRAQLDRWNRRVTPRGGDVIMTRRGRVGDTAVVPDGLACTIGQNLVILRSEADRLDQGFLRWALRGPSFDAEVQRLLNVGAVFDSLNCSDIPKIRVPVPPIEEQRAIAGVLGALDDKIESNRRLVHLAEALGRAELAKELAGPAGEQWEMAWPEVPLGSALSLIETGDRPKGGVAGISGGVPSVGAESIVAPGVFDFAKTKFVPRDYFEGMKRGVLQSGDVLLYKDGGTPGNFIPKVSMCQDGFPFEEAVLNSHVYRLRIAPPYSQGFLYYWLSSERLLDEMWLRGTGAAIPSLNSTNVKGLPLAVPPEDRLRRVLPIVDDLLGLLHRSAREQRTLEQFRDALLPELLSGRLRVREAEKVVEGVV